MHVESAPQALPRRRTLELSPFAFRRLAYVALGMLILIVASGATVRLTGSGLGCEHWPGCQPGEVLPAQGFHSYVEFSNRGISAVTILSTLVLWLASLRTPGLGRGVRRLALATFLATLAQAPLGAVTVHFHLNPYLVISHLLLSLVVIGAASLVALEASALVRGRAGALPRHVRAAGAVLLAAAGALVVTGTLATAGGKYPGSSGSQYVPRLGNFEHAVYVHVRATAVFGIVFLVLAGWAWRERARHPWLIRACAGLLGILAVQMAIGETQYRNGLPWWLVLAHVAVAACVWAWAVGLVARLWRPLAPAGGA